MGHVGSGQPNLRDSGSQRVEPFGQDAYIDLGAGAALASCAVGFGVRWHLQTGTPFS